MAVRKCRSFSLAIALALCFSSCSWEAFVAARSAEVFSRRALLSLLGSLALPGGSAVAKLGVALPKAPEEKPEVKRPMPTSIAEARLEIFRGKAETLRANAEWYRFYVGDLIVKTSGATAIDGLSADDPNCAVGLCQAGVALTQIGKVLSSPGSRGGGVALAAIDSALITPMSTLAQTGVWDPDADVDVEEVASKVCRDFQITLRELGQNVKDRKVDAVRTTYEKSLQNLNSYFRAVNSAGLAKPSEAAFLPELPLKQEELEASEYWQVQRKAFEDARDPVLLFQESQALAPRDVRQALKRWPGATLLVR